MIVSGRRQHHQWSQLLKRYAKMLCIAYILVQTSFSLYEVLWQNPMIQLTTVEKQPNEKIYHPLYTFCPIFDQSADVKDENATLLSVLVKNGFKKPPLYFVPLQNSIKEKPRTYSTWLKTPTVDKQGKTYLVQCVTFEFKDSVTPGQEGGKV